MVALLVAVESNSDSFPISIFALRHGSAGGAALGLTDGLTDGETDGDFDGLFDGLAEGDTEGEAEPPAVYSMCNLAALAALTL